MVIFKRLNNRGLEVIRHFYVVFLFLSGFSSFAHANWETTLNFGVHAKDAIGVHASNSSDRAEARDSISGILAADSLYRVFFFKKPLYSSELGVGLRYQLYLSNGRFSDISIDERQTLGVTSGPFTSTGHRLALLLNYRTTFKRQLFVGFVYGIDIWKGMKLKQGGQERLSGSQFIGFIGQIGLEVGVKLTSHFMLKAELGVNNFNFNKVTCRNCSNAENILFHLSKPYITLGAGWLFAITSPENGHPSSYEEEEYY